MTNRQTFSQPNVNDLHYPLLQQKGNEDSYKLTGRINGELVTVLGTAEQINMYAGDEVVSHHSNERMPLTASHNVSVNDHRKETKETIDIEQRVKSAARALWNIFLDQKKITPLKKEIDVYATKEGKEVVDKLFANTSGDDVRKILGGSFRKALEFYGLTYTSPSSDYLTDPKSYHGGWLKLSRLGKDSEREAEIEKRTNTCAKVFSEIFISKQNANPSLTEVDVFAYPAGKTAIAILLAGTSGDDTRKLLGDPLQKSLSAYGLKGSSPSSIFLTDPINYGGGWFNVSQI